jgi:hypothetical protein
MRHQIQQEFKDEGQFCSIFLQIGVVKNECGFISGENMRSIEESTESGAKNWMYSS